ncbi:MAG: hypothetical protein U9P44_01175 [archaeon]|nr:hypothetical protein [archaeon]
MKPSIETMLRKPYDEALKHIDKKIATAINTNGSTKRTQKKSILEYIIKNSDENHPATLVSIRNAIYSKHGENINNTVTNNLQTKLSGFIGWIQLTKNKGRTNSAYFFRTEVAAAFECTYGKEPGYLPLKEIFLKTLDYYTSTLILENTEKIPVYHAAQVPVLNI